MAPRRGPASRAASIWVEERERRIIASPPTRDAKWVVCLGALLESDFDTQTTIQDPNLGLGQVVGDSLILVHYSDKITTTSLCHRKAKKLVFSIIRVNNLDSLVQFIQIELQAPIMEAGSTSNNGASLAKSSLLRAVLLICLSTSSH